MPATTLAAARAWVVLYDTTGSKVALFDDWYNLEINHKLNDVDTLMFEIDGNDPRVALFVLDSILEVWRTPTGIAADAYIEYTGMHRTSERQLTTDQKALFISGSVGLNHLLKRRVIAYPTVTAFTLKQAAAETVMKEIVNENVGPGAVSPPRYSSGITSGFSVAVDSALGPIYTAQLANDNVLDALNTINVAVFDTIVHSTVDFDVIRVGPVAFEFRTYFPQRGTDRTATLAFAPELGNMINVVYRFDASNAINSVFVLGPGQDSSRWVLPVQASAGVGVLSPWDILESTTSDSSTSSDATYESMLTSGQVELNRTIPQEPFTFDVVQEDVALYGRDYFVGDLVTARVQDITRTVKIVAVRLTIKEGVEDIKPDFNDLP